MNMIWSLVVMILVMYSFFIMLVINKVISIWVIEEVFILIIVVSHVFLGYTSIFLPISLWVQIFPFRR